MQQKQKLSVLVFDDQLINANLVEQITKRNRFSKWLGNKYGDSSVTVDRSTDGAYLNSGNQQSPLSKAEFEGFSAFIVDLKMPYSQPTSPRFMLSSTAKELCDAGYGGIGVLEMLESMNLLSCTVLHSGNVETLLSNIHMLVKNNVTENDVNILLRRWERKGLVVTRKGRPSSIGLEIELFSILAIEQEGQVIPPESRRSLLRMSHRGITTGSLPHALILGESGTGKDSTAHLLHIFTGHYSDLLREENLFRSVEYDSISADDIPNMASEMFIYAGSNVADTLAGSILFGWIKGSFTDAVSDSWGLIPSAILNVNRLAGDEKTSRVQTTAIDNQSDYSESISNREANAVLNCLISALDQTDSEAAQKAQNNKNIDKIKSATQAQKIFNKSTLMVDIFLDELGDLPDTAQNALLRVIEHGDFLRTGESIPISIRGHNGRLLVRLIAATSNKAILNIATGNGDSDDTNKFRADLVYRLGLPPLQTPALDKQVVLPLVESYFKRRRTHIRSPVRNKPVIKKLSALVEAGRFPGHHRQFIHFLEAVISVAESRSLHDTVFFENHSKEILVEDIDSLINPLVLTEDHSHSDDYLNKLGALWVKNKPEIRKPSLHVFNLMIMYLDNQNKNLLPYVKIRSDSQLCSIPTEIKELYEPVVNKDNVDFSSFILTLFDIHDKNTPEEIKKALTWLLDALKSKGKKYRIAEVINHCPLRNFIRDLVKISPFKVCDDSLIDNTADDMKQFLRD